MFKSTRDEKGNYTRDSEKDINRLRERISVAFRDALAEGYNPHEIFYEVCAEANMEFLMHQIGMKGN